MPTPPSLDIPTVYHINVQQSTPFSINGFTAGVPAQGK